jgi:protoheme IX farnesyltransferase
MSNLLHLQIKLCRKVLGNSYNPNLLLKKHVYFTPSAASYVNKSHRKSTTIHLTEDATKVFPDKPAVAPAWRPTPSTDRTNIVQHYLKLSKIRLTTLVVVTSMAGYAVAPAPFVWDTFALCVAGTGLLSAAANAVNQFHEVPFDAQMSRTKHRVLVCGRLT